MYFDFTTENQVADSYFQFLVVILYSSLLFTSHSGYLLDTDNLWHFGWEYLGPRKEKFSAQNEHLLNTKQSRD